MKFLSWNIILVSRGWPIGYWLMSWVFGPSCLETPGITDDSKPSKSQQLSNWNLKMSAQLSCADKKRTLVLLLMFAIMFCMPECHSYVKQFARNFQMPLLIGKRSVCTVCLTYHFLIYGKKQSCNRNFLRWTCWVINQNICQVLPCNFFFGGSHSTPSGCHFGPSHKYIDKLRAHWSSGKKRNLNTWRNGTATQLMKEKVVCTSIINRWIKKGNRYSGIVNGSNEFSKCTSAEYYVSTNA